jgi:hypothetical protein
MNDGPIRGKVARVLNSRELAITVGKDHGVVPGMYFDVMDPKGEDITDPDTGDVLGSIERPKVRVQVVSTQDKISLASTYKKHQVNVGGRGGALAQLGPGLSDLFLPPKMITKYETLKTTEKTWEDLEEKESYVKTGDPVVQVVAQVDVGEDEVETGAQRVAGPA